MFKKRTAGGDSNRRKRVRLESDSNRSDEMSSDNALVEAPKVDDVVPKVRSGARDGDGKEPVSPDDSDDERKFTLSVNDEATREDRLTVELKNSTSKGSKPIGQPSNVRTTLLMDYQPDICKDFQQTGYCGYGDSCKFLHTRDSFKGGWQLNHEWKIDEKGTTEEGGKKIIDLSEVPPKCAICEKEYKSPIVTSCGHYFCSSCFTKRVRRDSKCLICGQDTHGVAKMANDLRKLLKTKYSS